MDYSQTMHDADDPAGASPWGNSPATSPARNTTHFDPITTDPPPFRYQPSSGLSREHSATGTDEFQAPSTQGTTSAGEDETETSQMSDVPEAESAATSEPPPVRHQGAPKAAPETQPVLEQQPPKPTQPQVRLQAKITGLERTGKKDPILRFDVHV